MKVVKGWAFPDADEFMVRELRDDGTYQASHLAAALSFVSEFSCAIDGGAHIGTWSKILSGRFDRVIAIEPSADTFEALRENMQAFGCTNVDLQRLALGAQAGFVHMELDEKQEALKNTGGRFVREGGPVARVTLDSLTTDLPTLGFLKLDIEGSEPFALEGARDTLARCRPIVLFENKYLWKRYELPREAAADVLRSVGYAQLAVVGRDEIWGPRA